MDLSSLSAAAKLLFTKTGRRHATDDVLAQIGLAKAGWAKFGAALPREGFSQGDFDAMVAHAAAQQASYDGREETQRDKQLARRSERDIAREAKAVRRDCAQLARATHDALAPIAPTSLNEDLAALDLAASASSSGADLTRLRDQLRAFDAAFARPALTADLDARGGVEVRADLARVLPELDAAIAALALPRGVADLTEQLDLVDGVLIHYARAARRAARAAARRAGQPAIADAFALTHL
jgi:hypothetical protein